MDKDDVRQSRQIGGIKTQLKFLHGAIKQIKMDMLAVAIGVAIGIFLGIFF